MNASLRTKLVYASLPLALVWAAYNFGSDGTKARVDKPAPEVIQAVPKAKGAVDARLIDIEKESSQKWGVDPFRTMTFRQQMKRSRPVSQWLLSGIVYSKENPMAFLNKERVQIGAVVDQARVVTIERKSVTIVYKGRRIKLAVKKG